MNITELRGIINNLLSSPVNLIGSYTLPSGAKIPALYVVGQDGVPKDWKVTGLEVTISQYPEVLPTAGVGMANVLQQWEVILLQYTPKGLEFAQAMERISRRFPDCTLRLVRGSDISYKYCRVVIPDREMKTVLR